MGEGTRIRRDRRSVSAVVASVLLVAIVVLLAGVAFVFLGSLTEPPVDEPDVEFEYAYDQDCLGDDSLTVVHGGGDTLDSARTFAVMNGTSHSFADIGAPDSFTAGNSVVLDATGSTQYSSDMWGETLRIVWEHPENDNSFVLAEFDVPQGCAVPGLGPTGIAAR